MSTGYEQIYLDLIHVITSAGIHPADGRPVDVNYCSVLAYYILSKGRGEREHSFLPNPYDRHDRGSENLR
jgi:hypothetical protein